MVKRKAVINVIDLEALDRAIVKELQALLNIDAVKSLNIKDNLFIPVFKPNYKVVLKTDNREIRLYPPCKRTIIVNGRQYYLPFPNIVFQRKYTPPGKRSNWNKEAYKKGYTNLFIGLTTESMEKIYHIPFQGVHEFCACLDMNYHYDYPGDSTFEDLVKVFWSTGFIGDLEAIARYSGITIFGGRFHAWSKLKVEQIEADFPKLEKLDGHCYNLKQFEELKNVV